ncbi:MAG: ankyrin repeat domain-containing protein [Candidatus Babeliales bacterium]
MKIIVTIGVALLTLTSGLYASEEERKAKLQEEFFRAITAVTVCNGNEATEEQLEHIQSLIDAKADLNETVSHGRSPLRCAAGSPAIMELLLTHKADVDCMCMRATYNWGSGLNYICESIDDATSREKCIRTLLKHGDNINKQDKNGNTPIHTLVQKNTATPQVVELLLAHGANPNIATKDDYTVLRTLDERLDSKPLITSDDDRLNFKIPACLALRVLQKHRKTLDALGASLPMFSLDVVGVVAEYFCGKHGADKKKLEALYEKYTELIQDLRKRGELS